MPKQYYVYILAKERNSTFYVGFTSDLKKRIIEEMNPGWNDLYETIAL